MNYYQFHIGDYRRDTAHLSLLEHGVYRQLLDWYYLSEEPISEETQVVLRRLCARTEAEFEAIKTVLNEFFYRDSGWHHKRCDYEIKAYQVNCQKNKLNGKLGGRPKKTQSVFLGFEKETQKKPKQKATNNQEPITNNHKPIEKEKIIKKEKVASAQIPKPPDVDETVWNDFLQMRKAKQAPVTETAIRGIEREASKAGINLQDALQTCCAQGWRGFKAEWVERRKPHAQHSQTGYMETFKERDQRRAMEEMEQWTGRTHPELERMRQRDNANVIDITPVQRMERIA